MFSGILAIMNDRPQDRRHILFSVKADARTFPAELWQRFRATTEARGEAWVDVLRRLVEQYIRQEPKP
jgi:hypothetical protein